MKKNKLIILSLLILVMSIGLIGCSSGNDVSEAPPQEESPTPSESVSTPEEDEEEIDFPTKDIRFIIPNAPGGGNDATVRALIPGMREALGGNLIPENQGGSNGVLAAMEIINGDPDGYKLYFNSQTLLIMPHSGMPDVDVERFQPVAQVVEDTAAVMVNADSPYETLDDLIEAAQSQTLRMGHNGVGALWNLAGLMFQDSIGVEFQQIGYTSGGAEMLTALAAGEVDVLLIGPPESKSLIDAGRVRALAVGSDERHALIPDVPTAQELGVDYNFPVWRGVFTSAGTPEPILRILSESIRETVESDEFINFAENNGFPIRYRNYEEFTEFFNNEKILYKELFESMD